MRLTGVHIDFARHFPRVSDEEYIENLKKSRDQIRRYRLWGSMFIFGILLLAASWINQMANRMLGFAGGPNNLQLASFWLCLLLRVKLGLTMSGIISLLIQIWGEDRTVNLLLHKCYEEPILSSDRHDGEIEEQNRSLKSDQELAEY